MAGRHVYNILMNFLIANGAVGSEVPGTEETAEENTDETVKERVLCRIEKVKTQRLNMLVQGETKLQQYSSFSRRAYVFTISDP